MSEQVFTKVDPDFVFESTAKTFVPAPVNKLLKFEVTPSETTEQINNFKTTPDGKPNPDYGKPQPVFIFKAKLAGNGIEADGQIYSSWITGYYDEEGNPRYSFGERSKFGKVAEALYGTVEEFRVHPAGEMVGMPFQCALAAGKKDPNKQVLNVDKIMPAADDQVKATADVAPTDIQGLGAEFDAILEEAGK